MHSDEFYINEKILKEITFKRNVFVYGFILLPFSVFVCYFIFEAVNFKIFFIYIIIAFLQWVRSPWKRYERIALYKESRTLVFYFESGDYEVIHLKEYTIGIGIQCFYTKLSPKFFAGKVYYIESYINDYEYLSSKVNELIKEE